MARFMQYQGMAGRPRKTTERMRTVVLTLPPEQIDRLNAAADSCGTSRSRLARQIFEHFFENPKKIYEFRYFEAGEAGQVLKIKA